MPYNVLPNALGASSGLIAGPFAITGFGAAPNTVSALTLGVNAVRGDALDLLGSTSNDGDYIVLDVVNANTVEVFPAPTLEAAAGNVALREQNHRLEIIDEPVVSADTIAAAMALLDSRLFERKFAVAAQTPGREFSINGFLFREFFFDNTGPTTIDFLTENEVWFLDWDGAQRSGPTFASHWSMIAAGGATAGALININLGSLSDINDPRSVRNGAVFLNGFLNFAGSSEVATSVYGSYLHMGLTTPLYTILDGPGVGAISGSIVNAGMIAPVSGSSLETLQTVIHNSATFGIAPIGAIANAANFLQANAANFGVVFSPTEVILREVELSNAAFTPTQLLFSSAFQFIDPREDYTALELFQLNGAAGAKSYTFNPRFTDINFSVGPSPLVGAEVTIERLADGHYISVTNPTVAGTYTVTINGEDHVVIFAGGSPAVLRNQLVVSINAGTQPITATNGSNNGQIGGPGSARSLIISSDVADTLMTISVTQPAATLALDPAALNAGSTLSQDYRELPIPGSPFIVDGNGRINTAGVELAAFVGYENGVGTRFINLQYRIIVEGNGFRRVLDGFKPTAPFLADYPVEDKSMGDLAA